MDIRFRYALALLLSLAAHVTLVWWARSSERAPLAPPASARALAVRVASAPRPPPAPLSRPDSLPAQPSAPLLPSATAPPQADLPSPITPIPTQVGIRYFRAHELSEKPRVSLGLSGGNILIVPGIALQVATIDVGIDGDGNVDFIVIGRSDLSEEEKRQVTEAFLRDVKFDPGKVGRLPVPSQVTLDIVIAPENQT